MNQYNYDLVGDMIATGEQASRELNDELYPLVAQGNAVAIKSMIEGNMALVIDKVDTYIALHPDVAHIRDDIVSEGFVGLCRAVNKMSTGGLKEHANATGCMSYWIHDSIGRIVDKESGHASRFTRKRHREKARAAAKERGDDIDQDKIEDKLPHQVPMPKEGVVDRVVDPTSLVELRDLIDSCCETDIDRAIVRMREKAHHHDLDSEIGTAVSSHPGMVDKEIANALGIPVTTCFVLRRAIYTRFLAKSGMKGEP